MIEEKELTAYCGLYCGDCYRYKGKIADLARDLRKELRQEKFDSTAEKLSKNTFFATLKNYPQCYEVLGEMVKFRCNRACRGGGGPPVCKMRICCRQKNIEGCWVCVEFESCKKLDFLHAYHEDAHLKNLRILKKSGTEAFVKGKRYW
ncbi:MAG: hypothetical protein A2Y92_01015 [Chloroflexi bacterium RBG_13_57_8]|nr:MAG: hypothetical protein A2Y92_01015 [Chloroflexi bacterium RBG_13_57_8]